MDAYLDIDDVEPEVIEGALVATQLAQQRENIVQEIQTRASLSNTAQEKMDETNPSKLLLVFFYLRIVDILLSSLSMLIGFTLGLIPFVGWIAGPIISWMFKLIMAMFVQVWQRMHAKIFRYARRVRWLWRIAKWLNLIPLLGSLGWFFICSFIVLRELRKEHLKAKAEFESHQAVIGALEEQVREIDDQLAQLG